MRKKLILFLMLALLGSTPFLRADVTSYGFETGMPEGWTVIDANGDGYTWCLTSAIPTTWTYYASVSLDWYRTGTDAICSGSFINGVGAITPDEYLVTPLVTLSSGSSFSFWAAAADASYPAEHFGVFVSDNGTSGWTMVNEWTLTAKSGGQNGGRASRNGNGAKLATWHEFTVDLSAYAGDKYIALRHFNCNDQYIMAVDDITINGEVHGGTTPPTPPTPPGQGSSLTVDFETGDFSQYEFNNTSAYPWAVIAGGADGSSYAMQSTNAGVASSESTIEATVEFAYDGTVSFDALCQGEGTSTAWDKCIFKVDGQQKFAYGAHVAGWNHYSYPVTAGTHTFTWSYTKDSSVNPTGDSFTVDNIVFEGLEGAPVGPGLITDPWEPDYDAPLGTIEILYPENAQQNIATPLTLRWTNAENAAQYKVEFGSVYGHLETVVDVTDVPDWNGILALADLGITLDPNTRYYWNVYNYNNTGEVMASGLFTTVFNKPTNVRVTETEIFTDETTVVKWNIVGGAVGELPETIIGTGSNTNNYLPTYNLYNYSLTQQIYTAEEIGNAGIINTISFYPVGSITRNLDIYLVNTDKTSFTGSNDWITVTADDLVYSGNVAMTPNTWTTVTLVNPFFFDGTNLALVVDDNSGDWTSSIYYNVFDAGSQAIRVYSDDTNYNPTNPSGYNGTVMNVKNQIAINYGAKGMLANRDLLGCNIYVDSVKVNEEPITERQYTLENLAYNMEGAAVTVTGVYDYGESNYSDAAIVYVSGYSTVTGTVKEMMSDTPIADVQVKFDGKDEFNNTVHFTATTDADGVYTINNIKVGTYTAKAIVDGFDPSIVEDVAVVYGETLTLDFYVHENYSPVSYVIAEEGEAGAVANVSWSFGEGSGSVGGGDAFTEGFEGGMPEGWTVIDANNDGYTWCLTSAIPSTWTYYASMTLDWYRTGSNAICSGSYINGVGALTPDEYLVTSMVGLGNGSTFSFWAAATDASYAADHFGVFVSDNGTSDWTMVNEWTLTGKSGGNGGRASRDGNGAKIGTWHQFSVDLSAYAGDKYIAIRHFNCNDMYIMCVDDIELSNGTKAAPAHAEACGTHIATAPARNMWDLLGSFTGTSAGQQAVATDGEYVYTASWQTTPTGGHTFYQYTMDGTFVEGFEITGATGIRDLTFDGEYFYGSSGGAQIFILDFTNRTLVGTINCSGLTSRHLSYDPERDGFWSGNWTTLALYSRTGAVIQSAAAPESAYGSAYYKDEEDVEHLFLFCQPNSDAKVYDYNIATNTISSAPVFDFAATPGFDGIAGGCFIGNYGDKLAFYGNSQQDPNLIGIYEIAESQGVDPGNPGSNGGSQLETSDHYFMIYRQLVFAQEMPENEEDLVVLIADQYGMDFADTSYVDTEYAQLAPGTYKYGVSAVYPWRERSDNNVTPIVWSNDLDKDMTTPLTINVVNSLGEVTGTQVTLTNLAENISYSEELDETGVLTIEDFRKGNYNLTVTLDGYIAQIEDELIPAEGIDMDLWYDNPVINVELLEYYAPVTTLVVSSTGLARWTDMLPNNRLAQRYHVLCDHIFQGETENNYMILNTENLVPGQTYTAEVAVIYSTGMSEFVSADFTYMSCDGVDIQIDTLMGSVDLSDVTLTWTTGSGVTPPTPPTPPGSGDSFTEGFESGMPSGWTVIDANNDSWTWCLTSAIPSTWTYYASLSLDWYRTGTNAICSGSFINGVGALTPDEYLVTSQVTLTSGSTFSFWAAATDASYPADHFGVFVSDNGTSGWTMVNEWTLTGKSNGEGGRASRDGNGAKLGTWHQFSVDLSAFAGQKYIAIRHFNCNDQYIMCVDDIELSVSKGGNTFMAAGQGFGLANNSLTDDGNWYYYDNGINEDAIGTGGGNFWWGVMFPAGTYQGNKVSKIAVFDYMAMTGTASIYQGGSNAPAGNALGQINVSLTGSTDFVEFTFAEPIEIDPAQNVWVVMYNGSGATYPAAVCANTGDANGRWVSLDGSTWEDLASYGLDYTFMVRAYIEQGAGPGPGPGTTTTNLTPGMFNIFFDGECIGATTENNFTWICEDDLEHEYTVVYIDQDYNVSCAASIIIVADPLAVGQFEIVSAIYPNPTNGDLHVNTNADMKSITIFNMLGQMVYNREFEGTETIINMAQFDNGIYMVNIVTENGTSVHRIIVNK